MRYPLTPDPPAADAEVAVVRRIRREVAERLTRATRAQETATGAPMPADEHATMTRRLITEALDAYATAEMNAGRPPLRPDAESRVARAVADMLLGAGGLEPLLKDDRVEEVNADGCDQVFVRYSDGRRAQVGPIADSDAEMVELIRRLAADAGRAPSPARCRWPISRCCPSPVPGPYRRRRPHPSTSGAA